MTKIAELGGIATDSADVLPLSKVAVDSRGRYFVAPVSSRGQIAVYNRLGRLEQTIGRFASGPGEYRLIGTVKSGAGDSLHVFDFGLLRHSVLSPDLTYVRATAIPGPFYDAVFSGNGNLLLAGPVATPAQAGFSVHLYDAEGNAMRSFGELRTPFTQESQVFFYRPIALTVGDRVWIGTLNRYRLELWDLQGNQLATFARHVSWYQEWTDPTSVNVGIPPPRMWALSQDSIGRLWIVLAVPDARVRDRARPRVESPARAYQPERMFDTIVELFDPRTGRIIASLRDFGAPLRFIRDGVGYRYNERSDGSAFIEVVRLELVGNP
jgi:hypothetical protein